MVESKGKTLMIKKAKMHGVQGPCPIETAHLNSLFKHMAAAIKKDQARTFEELLHYALSPVESEGEVLGRAKLMDELMDMAQSEDDIVMLFACAISDRIEEFENEQLDLPKMKPCEVLAGLMQLHGVKQKDLLDIAPQHVISELINEKRAMTVEHIKEFSRFFSVPVTMFIN